MISQDILKNAISTVLIEAYFPELPNYYRGKVRENYDLLDGRRIMISTDRQSAFDQVLAAVPFKGQVLTQITRFWFDAVKDICPNYVLDYPDPNVIIGKQLNMLPIEIVVRDYMTGSTDTSIWMMYKSGQRMMYGQTFFDGMSKNDRLDKTIITPTTKADHGKHDVPITPNEIVSNGLLTKVQWDEIVVISNELFCRGRDIATKNELILADTKFEFGTDSSGRITVADEIFTPDSSRYWRATNYNDRISKGEEPESLDKEFLRLWIIEHCDDPYNNPIPAIPNDALIEFSQKYIMLYETVTGCEFVISSFQKESIKSRIRRNLLAYF
ncbi:MAG: phosphoribosylaminoimidazolesuccinocarboxamide synthase [Rhodospirillaceae bacterium]|jgi:phosphoribosylaminoimidazole-succinocarboxamide synthase|nr:phosphoribosylaminoimidazolesuccinocarboxamide synthase [Rhodospirillaceae bacterium]